jgi:hypothetical protein
VEPGRGESSWTWKGGGDGHILREKKKSPFFKAENRSLLEWQLLR